jgi:hypothetical protein
MGGTLRVVVRGRGGGEERRCVTCGVWLIAKIDRKSILGSPIASPDVASSHIKCVDVGANRVQGE